MKRLFLLKFALLLTLSLPTSMMADDALNHWFYRNSTPLNRVVFTSGIFIGLGDNGTLLTSTNGSNWTSQTTGTTEIPFPSPGGFPRL